MMNITHLTVLTGVALSFSLTPAVNGAIFWSDFSGVSGGSSTAYTSSGGSDFTLGANTNGNSGGTLTAADQALTNVTFSDLAVVTGAGMTFGDLDYTAQLENITGVGAATDYARIGIRPNNSFSAGETICFSFSFSNPMASVSAIDPDNMGNTTTVNGSSAQLRFAMLYDPKSYFDPTDGSGGRINNMGTSIDLGGYGDIAGLMSGNFTDNFDDATDILGTAGSSFTPTGAQVYDGRFNTDPAMAFAAIDVDTVTNTVKAGDYGITTVTFKTTLLREYDPSQARFVFTLDGAPIPEPSSSLFLSLSGLLLFIRKRNTEGA